MVVNLAIDAFTFTSFLIIRRLSSQAADLERNLVFGSEDLVEIL